MTLRDFIFIVELALPFLPLLSWMKSSALAVLLETLWEYFERSPCNADGEQPYRSVLLVSLKAIKEFMTRVPSLVRARACVSDGIFELHLDNCIWRAYSLFRCECIPSELYIRDSLMPLSKCTHSKVVFENSEISPTIRKMLKILRQEFQKVIFYVQNEVKVKKNLYWFMFIFLYCLSNTYLFPISSVQKRNDNDKVLPAYIDIFFFPTRKYELRIAC